MAVTKQTYTATPTWTASNAADLFEDAFIDANLMTAWHDSFANGSIEHRVLKISYDGTKTYGDCYYWFVFTTTFIGFSIATGWNTGTNVPTGTQYLDFYATATNTTVNHTPILTGANTGTQLDLVRYTSGIDTDYSWFVIRNSAVPFPFLIAPASATIVPWIDLDKHFFHHFVRCRLIVVSATTTTSIGTAQFFQEYRLRRSYIGGYALRGSTTISRYREGLSILCYSAFAHAANSFSNDRILASSDEIIVPYGFTDSNPAFASDFTPVLKGCSFSAYLTNALPLDLGVHFPFTTTAFSFGDKIIVDAGIEEWEILDFANNNQATASNPLLVARVV
jgi:hypothetical protein